MTTPRRGGDLSLEKARILSSYETSWRQWRAFVAEQRDQLRRHGAEGGAFADPLGMLLTTGEEPIKANLPGDVRQELMRVLELRRQESQAAADDAARLGGESPPDRDAVFAEVLAHIERELAGSVHPSGLALVWHEGRLHEFNHRRVLGQASDADYAAQLGDESAQKRRTLIIAGGGGLVVLLAFALIMVSNFPEEGGGAAARVALVEGKRATLWDARYLAVGGREFEIGFARAGYPLLLCAPEGSQAAMLPEATLTLTGTGSVRRYQLVAPTAERADLLLADCAESPPRSLALGRLVGAASSAPLDPALLRGVQVSGPDRDPAAIPPGRMQVTLRLDAAAGVEGTLVLADGSRVAPSRTTPASDTVTLVYLVPLASTEQPAGWEASRPNGLPAVLPLTLPAPTSRAALLRQSLAVAAGEAQMEPGADGARAQISLTLTNGGAEPLELLAGDLTAAQGSALAPPCIWPPPRLRPGDRITIQVSCPLPREGPLEVSLAGWRARLVRQPEP